MNGTRRFDQFATIQLALHMVRVQGFDGQICLLQNRDTDVRIQYLGSGTNGLPVYRWYSERLGQWVQHSHGTVLESTTEFPGPFEVRRAD